VSNTYRVAVRIDTVQTFELEAESKEDARAHFWEGKLIYDDIQDEEVLHVRATKELGPIAAELG
jgi:hypothetical protein